MITSDNGLNDPTQFEQVDETCELGGLFYTLKALTAFWGLTHRGKSEMKRLKPLQIEVENEKIRRFEHGCLI